MMGEEFSSDNIFILDGIVTRKSSDERHMQLVREMMSLPTIKVVEHPDMFVKQSEYTIDDFDIIIELRSSVDQEITYEILEKNDQMSDRGSMGGFNMFN